MVYAFYSLKTSEGAVGGASAPESENKTEEKPEASAPPASEQSSSAASSPAPVRSVCEPPKKLSDLEEKVAQAVEQMRAMGFHDEGMFRHLFRTSSMFYNG